jgi:hypothetical protein
MQGFLTSPAPACQEDPLRSYWSSFRVVGGCREERRPGLEAAAGSDVKSPPRTVASGQMQQPAQASRPRVSPRSLFPWSIASGGDRNGDTPVVRLEPDPSRGGRSQSPNRSRQTRPGRTPPSMRAPRVGRDWRSLRTTAAVSGPRSAVARSSKSGRMLRCRRPLFPFMPGAHSASSEGAAAAHLSYFHPRCHGDLAAPCPG